MKVFCSFRVFECVLWQKTKTRKRRKLTESFLNQKALSVNGLLLLENCYKAINLLSKSALITGKVSFKLQ